MRNRIVLLIMLLWLSLPVTGQDRTVLVLADSLSASYGIAIEEGWVTLLQNRLREQGYPHRVQNASISGDTTHGALSRLPALLEDVRPELVVVELGGNDGLRGLPPDEIRQNLGAIITLLQQRGIRVLLVPMLLPPNYGKFYIERFAAIYSDLALTHQVPLSGFILEGIADQPELMQSDGIHPVAAAQPRMLDNVWPDLVPLLADD